MDDKRLYISDDDKLIAGVCGGLADKINTDPTIVRLLYVLGTFLTGLWFGCLAYYLLTLFMPVREDSTWRQYHSCKKVKSVFLYSLVVIVTYSPILLGALYLIAIILGISLICLI